MLAFLSSAVAISLSGVITPGPITAATLAAGARQRHAGVLIALGHALIEIPLIALLGMGAAAFLQAATVKVAIGLVGGVVLLVMGLQLLLSLRKPSTDLQAPVQRHPLIIGIVVTAANPYFIIWWATVGLALATQALSLGAIALALFAVVHWLCDLGFLEVLSIAGFKGSQVYGPRAQRVVSGVCGLMLLGFAAKFLYDAGLGMILVVNTAAMAAKG